VISQPSSGETIGRRYWRYLRISRATIWLQNCRFHQLCRSAPIPRAIHPFLLFEESRQLGVSKHAEPHSGFCDAPKERLKKAYILSSRQLSNRRERITATSFSVRECFHARANSAKTMNLGDAQTFSGCHVGWNSCLSRQIQATQTVAMKPYLCPNCHRRSEISRYALSWLRAD